MATLEKPKQKKNKHIVPSKSSKSNNTKSAGIKKEVDDSCVSDKTVVDNESGDATTSKITNLNKEEHNDVDIKDTTTENIYSKHETISEASCSSSKEENTQETNAVSDTNKIDTTCAETIRVVSDTTSVEAKHAVSDITFVEATCVDPIKCVIDDDACDKGKDATCDIKSDVTNNKVLIPSAPVVEHPKQKIVMYPQLPIKELTETTKNIKLNESKSNCMKPFTITQLAALYNNPELGASKHFAAQFIESELRGINASQHPLHELLTNYLHSREKLQENSLELNQLKSEYKSCQNQLWHLESAKITGKAQCQDGTNVSATHEYKTAKFQKNLLENLIRVQNKIKLLANEVYTLHAYTTCLLKLKIDHYISSITDSCQKALGIVQGNAPVKLQTGALHPAAQAHVQELRICVSVLFSFQRRLYKDRDFVLETRAWLTDAVALLLRIADWQDHHYLLNQVLRCPAGIGSWATTFIQIPSPVVNDFDAPFSNSYINHIVAILSVLLCSVEKRDAFLNQILITLQEPHDAVAENLWVLVDSDGEEDEDNSCGVSALKENDLVALLNQVPMADLFRCVLLVRHQDGRDVWSGRTDAHHVLRLLAFCTVLVQLYEQGLSVYNAPRYHQFAKRLCRLIRQTLQYASDSWEIYRDTTVSDAKAYDAAMFERLQTEFDAFFLRATSCLYRAQKLGAWQFLAIAPFHIVSIRTLWQFFYMLHQGIPNDNDDVQVLLEDQDFRSLLSETYARQQFCERLCIMSIEESYYLLNTFANMIMARPASDEEFIKFGTLNLLQIGFSGDAESQESCCKCAGILLSNITSRYPTLISDILLFVKDHISDLNQIMFLFNELPLHLWFPTERDIDIVSLWLLQNPISSVESYTARKILSNLNWNFSRVGELFLPLSLHRRVALITVETVEKYAATADSGGFLEGVKQVAGQAAAEQALVRWAWQLIYQLRLHSSARCTTNVRGVPELVELDVLQRCIRENQPLACYVALAMTAVGHLLPLVCSQGLSLLEKLTAFYKHDAVLIAVYHIIPLFLDSADTLLMCTSFQAIIANLLSADRTYMKMAKSIISTEFPGTVLKHFSNMIETHIHNPHWHPLMEFWVRTLISVPNWNKDAGVLFLLNAIIRTAFFIPEKYRAIGDIFQELLDKATDRNSSSNSSLLSWVPLVGGGSAVGSALLLGPGTGISEPWLLYLITSLEHQHVELRTGLWPELLRSLYVNTGKTNIDATIKKAANSVKVPTYTSTGLCLYRWAQQALDTPLDHPLLPIIWQRFFSLYLARVPSNTEENRGSVGSKFFDGMVNTSFCKKLKKRLQETVEFYKKKLETIQNECETDNENGQTRRNKELEQRCVGIFSAYVLWLEEPLLQETTLYLPSLPPQYEPRYLAHIIQGSSSPWLELVNCNFIRSEYEKCKTEWDALCCQNTKLVQRAPLQKMGGGEVRDPVERILRRLTSYDKPLMPPPIKQNSFVIPTLPLHPGESVSSALQPYIKKLQQFAEIFSLQISEHGALDCQYKELVQQLYSNFQTKITMKKTCKPTCAGAALISVTFFEAKANESIKHQMQTNRTNFKTLLTRTLQAPVHSMCMNCASLEHTVDMLQRRLQECVRLGDAKGDEQFRNIGVDLFYYLLSAFNEDLKNYPPTQQLFNVCLDKLGQTYLCGIERETVRLVKTILQQPAKGNFLAPHFVATNLSTNYVLQLYSDICDNVDNFPEITFTLLSKFNIQNWLTNKKPRLAERSKFIQLVFQSLTRLGPQPSKQQYALHEVYRRHLLIVFRYEFPEHYGEVLMLALQHSAAQTLAVSVWMDLLNALAYPASIQQALNCDDAQLKELMRTHANRQRMLGARELADTVALIGRYFAQERLQFGLYGLYPKYRSYTEPLCLLLGMTLHALVVTTVEMHGGATLADTLLTDHLWPRIIEAFGPWLVPYSVNDCKDATAAWIQQLTDDRTVLLPWIQADISSAKKLFTMFVNCVLFIGDTLPGCSHLFCYMWQFYSINFAHPTVKEHIWTVVHSSLTLIHWEQFWPTLSDLEMMLKIIDQYLPECHVFLGHVFLEINWPQWIGRLTQGGNTVAITRAHHCLLHLLVKISREPTVRQADRARILLERARDFAWHILDVPTLEHVLDWCVMSCDPRVALPLDPAIKQIDYVVLGLLRVVACYDNTVHPINLTIVKKRQCFIRAYIKLLVNCSSRHKTLLTNKPQQFSAALTTQLDHMELIIGSGQDTVNQANLLVSEFLQVLNNSYICGTALKCMEQWLETRTAASEVLRAILRTTACTVSSVESAGMVLEAAFSAYFTPSVSQGSVASWPNAIELFSAGPPRQPSLEQALIISGRLLTLYALLLKNVSNCEDRNAVETLLDTLVGWLTLVKMNDVVESKLPLLWAQVIQLALRICHEGGEEKAGVCLRKFVNGHLLLVAENKCGVSSGGGWGRGLLGAIGLSKQGSVSNQCRFLCRAIAGYILAQLPEPRGEPQKVRCFAGASGPVGQPGGNTDCAKVLLKLDTGVSELKPHIEHALKQIQDPQNSLHNAESFLFGLVDILYSKAYLKTH